MTTNAPREEDEDLAKQVRERSDDGQPAIQIDLDDMIREAEAEAAEQSKTTQ